MIGTKQCMWVSLVFAALSLGSCSKDEPSVAPPHTPQEVIPLSDLYVLNEGASTTGELGSLTYISRQSTALPNAYYQINGKHLGSAAQDLFITGDKGKEKIYIITQNGEKSDYAGSTDGQGEGILSIASLRSLKTEAVYRRGDLPYGGNPYGLSHPTNIAVVGSLVYIRDDRGVYILDLNAKTAQSRLHEVDNSKGVNMSRMVVVGSKVYATRGNELVVMGAVEPFTGRTVTYTEDLPGVARGVQRSKDEKYVYVMCVVDGKNAIVRYDTKAEELTTHKLEDQPESGLQWVTSAPPFGVTGDTIYFVNQTSVAKDNTIKLYRHIFSSGKTELLRDLLSEDGLGIYVQPYNGLAVDPVTGLVYFSSIKGYGPDYKQSHLSVYDFRGTNNRYIGSYKDVVSFVAGIYPLTLFL